MNELLEKLTAWGVNLGEVRLRFLDDDELYIDCLHAFVQDPSFAALDSAIRDQNHISAFEHAHTLKGVAGNLGLAPLYHALSGLVECLRTQSYDTLERSYQTVLQEKNAFLFFVAQPAQ